MFGLGIIVFNCWLFITKRASEVAHSVLLDSTKAQSLMR